MAKDLTLGLSSLFIVAVVAALTPLVVGLLPRLHLPQVVVLIIGGIIIRPQVLGWQRPRASPCCRMSVSASCSCWPDTSWN
jgi:Kef-type K+ transport system membrane component KefB